MRTSSIETDVNKYAEGSCLIGFGDTRVLVTATVEDSVPGWMRNTGKGWITAEYGMLPRSTDQRMAREAARGKQSGRTQEIQRLIGRSLRAVVDLGRLPEVQVKVDCDVIQADGGTRTASISGAYVALQLAFRHLERIGMLKQSPLTGQLAAISCGICQGTPLLDLDYAEDSAAETDANFVMVADGGIVEIQAT
ncbi:MAG: ribonuclease PH, partial [Pseudomonadota bacterium]|nr:ribonuclease PH [Pseudomonadota bacterium]